MERVGLDVEVVAGRLAGEGVLEEGAVFAAAAEGHAGGFGIAEPGASGQESARLCPDLRPRQGRVGGQSQEGAGVWQGSVRVGSTMGKSSWTL